MTLRTRICSRPAEDYYTLRVTDGVTTHEHRLGRHPSRSMEDQARVERRQIRRAYQRHIAAGGTVGNYQA